MIPAGLRQFLQSDENGYWDRSWRAWCSIPDDHLNTHDDSDLLGDASALFEPRVLDSLYLSPSLNARMWSDDEHVYLQWDNRDKMVGDQPAWSAGCGQFTLTRDDFVEEVRSFHERLMTQMGVRVSQVLDGQVPPGVRVDTDALVHEHRMRSASIEIQLKSRTKTDWASVAQSIGRLEDLRDDT